MGSSSGRRKKGKTGWLITNGVDPNLAILAGLAMGAFAGWINGMVITRGNIPPFIATLGMLGIARGMALVITKGVSFQVLVPVFLYIKARVPDSSVPWSIFSWTRHSRKDTQRSSHRL